MTSRVIIFDHFMRRLAEIEAPTTPRGWVLNEYGRCQFSISTADPKCTEENMKFGNLVFIEHLPTKDADGNTNGRLPDWAGIILPPRTWDYGVLHMTAYAAESILAFRAMPYISVTGTPGAVFKNVLEYSHAKAKNIIIQPGTVDDLPVTYPDDLRMNAYDHIVKMADGVGMDWDVQGAIDEDGNLELTANLYNRKGVDTGFVLHNTNTELSPPLLTEQGTPSNQVFGYSQASTSQSRKAAEAINQGAFDDYGPLQLNQTFVGKHDSASVYNAAKQRADERGRPKKVIKRVVLDNSTAFDNLDIGNILTVRDTNVGFIDGGFGLDAQVRIIAMDYNDLSNKVPLTVETI